MGLFNLLGKKSNSSSNSRDSAYRSSRNSNQYDYKSLERQMAQQQKDLDYQNKLLGEVFEAKSRYEEDGDLDAVIEAFEAAFIKADPPCVSSQCFTLVDYYLKAGQNDKAWRYMNKLYTKFPVYRGRIRNLQAKILKKEKKYSDAIEMYMLCYLIRADGNNIFDKEKFLKTINVCANKLKLDESQRDQIAGIVAR